MTLRFAFRCSPFKIHMFFSVLLAASVAVSVMPQTVALEKEVEPGRTGRFFGFIKAYEKDDGMKEMSLRMLQNELRNLEKIVEDLEEHLKHKCDMEECARLEHDADELFDEVNYNSQNIAQLFLILQSVISQLDPCNRHFPRHSMTKKRQRHNHKRYGRELGFEALDDDFFLLQNETESRRVSRVEDYSRGEMGEEEGEGEEWEAEAEERGGEVWEVEERDVDDVEEKAFGDMYAMGSTGDAGYLGRRSGSTRTIGSIRPSPDEPLGDGDKPGGDERPPGYGYPPLIPIPFPYPHPHGRMKGGDSDCVSSLFQHCCGK